jgi:hypothetical protein
MRISTIALATILVAGPGAVRAQDSLDPFLREGASVPPERGLSIGARFAYGLPFGSLSGVEGDDLSDIYDASYPLIVDVGWRFNPSLYAGIFVQYAFVSLSSQLEDACAGADCGGSNIRFGANVSWSFTPQKRTIPWVGVGFGYEYARFDAQRGGRKLELEVRGWEYANFSGGVDWRFGSRFRVGPFATLTLGRYSTLETPVDPLTGVVGATQELDIDDPAFHEWLHLGVRAMFDF